MSTSSSMAAGRSRCEPEFDLGDIDAMAIEVGQAAELGLRSVVDAMPCDAGRNVEKLAELSRRTGIGIVAPTGLHHDRYYGPAHWSHRVSVAELADLFALDVTDGIDALDYSGPIVRRTAHRAGVLKVAGSDGGLRRATSACSRPRRRRMPGPGCRS
ncbi:MAG: hypothetical protein WKF78_05520 [Candidatus Limnocylindrales bacterium]